MNVDEINGQLRFVDVQRISPKNVPLFFPQIEHFFQRLPVKEQEVAAGRCLGMRSDEIAKEMGLTCGEVAVLLASAKEGLFAACANAIASGKNL